MMKVMIVMMIVLMMKMVMTMVMTSMQRPAYFSLSQDRHHAPDDDHDYDNPDYDDDDDDAGEDICGRHGGSDFVVFHPALDP